MNGDDDQPNYEDLDSYYSGYDRTLSGGFQISKGRAWAEWPFEPEQDGTNWSTEFQGENFPGAPDAVINPEASSCIGDAGDPPGSGTYVLGSVDGACQWIDTTTCP